MNAPKLFKIAAWAILAIGIIHTSASWDVWTELGQSSLSLKDKVAMLYMFVATGLLFVFTGWVQLLCIKQISDFQPIYKIIRISVILVVVCGVGAAVTLSWNPFAYIILLIGVYEVIILRKLK